MKAREIRGTDGAIRMLSVIKYFLIMLRSVYLDMSLISKNDFIYLGGITV